MILHTGEIVFHTSEMISLTGEMIFDTTEIKSVPTEIIAHTQIQSLCAA